MHIHGCDLRARRELYLTGGVNARLAAGACGRVTPRLADVPIDAGPPEVSFWEFDDLEVASVPWRRAVPRFYDRRSASMEIRGVARWLKAV